MLLVPQCKASRIARFVETSNESKPHDVYMYIPLKNATHDGKRDILYANTLNGASRCLVLDKSCEFCENSTPSELKRSNAYYYVRAYSPTESLI